MKSLIVKESSSILCISSFLISFLTQTLFQLFFSHHSYHRKIWILFCFILFFCVLILLFFLFVKYNILKNLHTGKSHTSRGKKAHQNKNTSTSEFDFGLNGKPVVFHDLNTNEYNVLLHWIDDDRQCKCMCVFFW